MHYGISINLICVMASRDDSGGHVICQHNIVFLFRTNVLLEKNLHIYSIGYAIARKVLVNAN